jgi:malate dehydrogenase (oxaloacetate-decarboxylating)
MSEMETIIGYSRLDDPLLNKSTAFTLKERVKYKLIGLLPPKIETLEQQVERTKLIFNQQTESLQKHVFLRALQDRNEVLFYRFLMENITETMPIIYTPTVGLACQKFSQIYRKARGLYLSYSEKDFIVDILEEIKRVREIKVIVITDGERILGLGDQGVGGLGIPIGKLSLYTLCGGIHPAHTLPIVIDVGTNNRDLHKDSSYLGWQHERLTDKDYFDFMDICIQGIKKVFPNVLLQFEDFAQKNAHQLLNTYQDQLCCFNDDIQGTAAVAAATVLSAVLKNKEILANQKIAIFGAGSAGCGIANLLVKILIEQGVESKIAHQQIYMIDRMGLLHDQMDLLPFQKPFAQPFEKIQQLFPSMQIINLEQVVETIQPQILLGVSGQRGQFTESIIRNMASYCTHPIILPLSNPNDKCEAIPNDILNWTNGRALIATGSPFPETEFNGKLYPLSQCNNSYIFPAMGLAVIAGKIKRVKPSLFITAALKLAEIASLNPDIKSPILPVMKNIREVSQQIAKAVLTQAISENLSDIKDIDIAIEETFWIPNYSENL